MKVGWELKEFEDCLDKVVYTEKIQRKDFLVDGEFPVISQEQSFINGYWNNSDAVFKIKKPIVIFGDHTQVLKYVDFDFVLGADGVKILQPIDGIKAKYFFYYLNSVNLKSLGYARHYRLLKEIQVPVPPIPEQERIVAVLDEAFASIAQAKANAERNLVNARELYESVLEEVFTNSGHGWEDKILDSVCSQITVGHVGPMASKYKPSGIPFLRSQNIQANRIDLDNVVYIDRQFNEQLKKSQLNPGDVAIVRTGYPGTSAVIPDSLPISNCSDLVIVKPGQLVNPYYLCLFFNSTYGKKLVLGNIVGAAQKHFNVTAAKNVSIPVPPLAEQRAIVGRLEALSAETGRLEAVYRQKVAALEALKKSVLQRAFEGQLSIDNYQLTIKDML